RRTGSPGVTGCRTLAEIGRIGSHLPRADHRASPPVSQTGRSGRVGAGGPLALVEAPVALVLVEAAAAHFPHARDQTLEETPVVRDDDQRPLVDGEGVLERLDHLEV